MSKIFRLGLMVWCVGCSNGVRKEITIPPPVSQKGAASQEFKNWGWRSPSCGDSGDWKFLSFTSEAQARSFADSDNPFDLSTTTTSENCYRIGTEILVFNKPGNTALAARALVTKISLVEGQSFVHYDVLEHFRSLRLSFPGERVPNCDSRFNDWNNFYIQKETAQASIDKLTKGEQTISVWNGAYNCFRIGTEVQVVIKGGSKGETFGSVIVREVRLTPYEDVTDQILRQTGQDPAKARELLEANLERDGGFISMMAFEYIPKDK